MNPENDESDVKSKRYVGDVQERYGVERYRASSKWMALVGRYLRERVLPDGACHWRLVRPERSEQALANRVYALNGRC